MKKSKKITLIVVGVLVLLLGICVFIANMALEMAVHPDDNKSRAVDSCYNVVYQQYPEMKIWRDSLEKHGLWSDTMLMASDGSKRHGVILRHDSVATGATIVVHGYTDNEAIMMRYAYLHYEMLGRNVVIPEHFGHGRSEGDHIRFGWLDRLDIAGLWIPFAHEKWPDLNIVEHGLSMGGATTMFVSGEEIPDSLHLKAFIEDCGYSSTWEELGYNAKQMGLPSFPIMNIANMLCRMKYGWDMKESDALKQLAKCKRPMLFIHGDADDFVPTYMVNQNYEAKTKGYKELMIVPGAAHAESIHKAWDEYVKRIKAFIDKVEK